MALLARVKSSSEEAGGPPAPSAVVVSEMPAVCATVKLVAHDASLLAIVGTGFDVDPEHQMPSGFLCLRT